MQKRLLYGVLQNVVYTFDDTLRQNISLSKIDKTVYTLVLIKLIKIKTKINLTK